VAAALTEQLQRQRSHEDHGDEDERDHLLHGNAKCGTGRPGAGWDTTAGRPRPRPARAGTARSGSAPELGRRPSRPLARL
jgi:hypothetical protein